MASGSRRVRPAPAPPRKESEQMAKGYPTLLRMTPQVLKTLPPGPNGERRSYRDTDTRGLVLRVGGSNPEARVWYFEYSLHDVSKRMKLGDLDEGVSLSERREEVRKWQAEVSRARLGDGPDPLAKRKQEREVTRQRDAAETFAKLGERALASFEKKQPDGKPLLRPATTEEWKRIWGKHLLPAMGDVDAGDPIAVKRAALKMGDALVEQGRMYGANRCLELARRIMSFAVATDRDGRYPANPLLRIAKPHKEKERTRTYSDGEVRAIVAGCTGTLYEDVVPLLLATGVRAGEALAAEWREFSGNTWTIPAAKSKIKHDRPVHLSRYALGVLEQVRAHSGDGFLFPAPTLSKHRERMQKVVYAIREASKVADFELHDLRRVVRTGLSDLRVPTDVGELCLGHLPPKLVRNYNPHPTFWKLGEQRKYMERWGARLERILADEDEAKGAEVVSIGGR